MHNFSDREKLEVLEFFIDQWRPGRSSSIEGERNTYLVLKAIASDIRGRSPQRTGKVLKELNHLIELADGYRTDAGARTPGRLIRVAEFVIGAWPTIRQALEKHLEEGAHT